ncbi:Galactose mutarotase-like superfamily protein [Actinidia rufa]|uniref:Galactose mutarotase-like superfamily protein n=1 Tax=Actinidia rufa TaxID=165716 RepID=A0A7J0GAF0_9ERIC|nr:Galactose mutarotase-like superfamily protein [Actinidia rufa]
MVLWFGKSSEAEEAEIEVYELKRGDFSVKLTNFGATVLSLILPDKKGKLDDVVIGFETIDGIRGAKFTLKFNINLLLMKETTCSMAKALNKATPVNLASHTYWNLGGHNSGDIFSHNLQLLASKITPVDSQLIPTGQIVSVEGTPYDFRQPRPIGSRFNELADGYDINYVVDSVGGNKRLKKVAVVQESKSGRRMELWSNAPGVQFYTSNTLGSVKGKDGFIYSNYAALCLETQGFPDSVNHPNFPSQIVNPGDSYNHVMVYRFTAN